ncbi:MAG: folate-binding protein [Kiloniellales bacterium]
MSEAPRYLRLPDRGFIAIDGPDARDFLQGVISNDVAKASEKQAIWSAFLTPQGKYLHDFFLLEREGQLLLETEAARLPDLLKRLRLYKLRSKVELRDASAEWQVALVWGEGTLAALGLDRRTGAVQPLDGGGGLAMVDPRHQGLGARVWQQGEVDLGLEEGSLADFQRLRIALAIPDGSRDMEIEKALLLENGFDELGGVDWQKGCYMGQELTARTKYRGLVKKRLLPIEKESSFLKEDSDVLQGGKLVGELRSHSGRHALALLRVQALESDEPMTCGAEPVRVSIPDWVVLPQRKEAAS